MDTKVQSSNDAPGAQNLSKTVSTAHHGSKVDVSSACNSESKDEKQQVDEVDDTLPAAMTKKQIVTERIMFLSSCWSIALVGWNDGSTGPLLLRIRDFYHVSYVVVSLLFVFACIGFIIGSLLIVPLMDRLGFGKALAIGTSLLLASTAYPLQAAALPFPVYVMSFTINGVGMAVLDSVSNVFVASLKHNTHTKMGILHAAYGLGALSSPLVATQFAQSVHWPYHYLVSLGLAVSTFVIVTSVFRLRTLDECLAEIGHAATAKSTSEDSTFSQMIHSKAVHLIAFFLLVYVGVEVTIGGWIVTFIVTERHGGPSSGYISTGFFGGLTAGRVLLLWVNEKIGERRVVFVYAILSIVLELVIIFVPSLIGDAVAVSFIGFLLGPMYPIAMNHSGKILPPWILAGAIGWMAGLGQAGSALIPFMTGAVAQRWGVNSLHPLLIVMMVIMMIFWALVPSHAARRTD